MPDFDNPYFNPDPHSTYQQSRGMPVDGYPGMTQEEYEQRLGYADWATSPDVQFAHDATAERLSYQEQQRLDFEYWLSQQGYGVTEERTNTGLPNLEDLTTEEHERLKFEYWLSQLDHPITPEELATGHPNLVKLTPIERLATTDLLEKNRAIDILDIFAVMVGNLTSMSPEESAAFFEEYHQRLEEIRDAYADQPDQLSPEQAAAIEAAINERKRLRLDHRSTDRIFNGSRGPEKRYIDFAHQVDALQLDDSHESLLEGLFGNTSWDSEYGMIYLLEQFMDDRQFIDANLFYDVFGPES